MNPRCHHCGDTYGAHVHICQAPKAKIMKDTGGPPFPVLRAGVDFLAEDGISLRDYFAAKAMQGLISTGDWDSESDFFATWSYEMADAMLEARK
jgi:hypothetical protein